MGTFGANPPVGLSIIDRSAPTASIVAMVSLVSVAGNPFPIVDECITYLVVCFTRMLVLLILNSLTLSCCRMVIIGVC